MVSGQCNQGPKSYLYILTMHNLQQQSFSFLFLFFREEEKEKKHTYLWRKEMAFLAWGEAVNLLS